LALPGQRTLNASSGGCHFHSTKILTRNSLLKNFPNKKDFQANTILVKR